MSDLEKIPVKPFARLPNFQWWLDAKGVPQGFKRKEKWLYKR